jgi:hypothetical protein
MSRLLAAVKFYQLECTCNETFSEIPLMENQRKIIMHQSMEKF